MRNEKTDRALRAGRSTFIVIVVAIIAFGLWQANRTAELYVWRLRVLDTPCIIKVQDNRAGKAMKAALDTTLPDMLEGLDVKFSRSQPYGLINDFNASTSTSPTKISSDVWRVIHFKHRIQKESGALSLTQSPIEDYWQRVQEGHARPPDPVDIERLLVDTASYKLMVPAESYLRKVTPDIQLNIDDCAPGYIADTIANHLRGSKIKHFSISIGSVIIASDMPGPSSILPIFPLSDGKIQGLPRADITVGCMATVGGPDSNKVHIDPRTGYPPSNRVFSVTVISDSGLNAAGMAAALYVLGPKNGLSWLVTNPIAKGEALFVMKHPDGTSELVKSPAFPLAQP